MKATVVLELPPDQEIEAVEESRMASNSGLIKKTIRYRSGMIATLYQDFQESIFGVHLESTDPLWISRNQILKVG